MSHLSLFEKSLSLYQSRLMMSADNMCDSQSVLYLVFLLNKECVGT
jgi:hypothetical protein